MKTVNISDLKAKLSAHIKLVRNGEEVLVCDRNKPVARIIPYRSDDYPEDMRDLIARGIVTPPRNSRRPPLTWPTPPGNIPDDVMQRIWDEEREDR